MQMMDTFPIKSSSSINNLTQVMSDSAVHGYLKIDSTKFGRG